MLVFILVFGSFILANPAQASWFGDAVAQLIGWIVYAFVYVIGLLIMLIMWVLIKIAQYNDFINATPVQFGWTIVRDICNMFFILILLIIAFATILRVERYSFKTLLPKLILMAVLINFSKLICGVFIDFTQVIMLTFVNGFKDIGTGNLTNMLGIDKIMSIDSTTTEDDGGEVTAWSIVGAYMLALMYSVIALITLVTMVAVLAMRMIMIWVYVVLSPMAYLLSAFPAGEKYASQWWEEFSKNLIVGPILAFFIWLSFVSLGGVATPGQGDPVAAVMNAGKTLEQADATGMTNTTASTTGPSAAITEAGSPDHMIKFIISIAMLIGGLQISQSLGGQAGGMAGKGMAKLQKMGSGAMKSVGTGLKRATGVERVQMAYKSYQNMKASERTTQAGYDANRANKVIGNAKQSTSNAMQSTSRGIVQGITGSNKKIRIAEAAKENIQKQRLDKTTELNNIQKELDKTGPSENRIAGRKAIENNATLDKATRETMLVDYDFNTNKIKKLEDEKIKISAEIETTKIDEKAKDQDIAKIKTRQETATKWVNRGLGAVVGGGLGAMTGNPILMAAGVVGGGLAKEKIGKSGQKNLKRAVNYNATKISTKKDELKYAGKENLMKTIKDTTDQHEHAAATAIALEKGYFPDSKAAGEQKQKVHDRFKNDDRVASVMNTAAEKNYVELAPPYATLRNTNSTAAQKSDANKQIIGGLESGHIKIADMSKDAIGLAIEGIVSGLRDKNFQKQYDGTSDAQQNTIKVELDKEIKRAESIGNDDQAYKAKKKLAYTESFNLDRFGPSSDLSDPKQKKNHEQKKEFLGSLNDSETAKAVKSKVSRNQFLQEVKVHLDATGAKINQGSTPEEIARHLKAILPNAGLETLDSTSKSIITAVKGVLKTAPQTPPAAPQTPPVNPTV